MTISVFNYDPAEVLPFTGYRSLNDPDITTGASPFTLDLDEYPSFIHWFESEKFRGVSERYRVYLSSLDDPSHVIMESRGFSPGFQRPDWDARRPAVIACGLFFQFNQNGELLEELLAADRVASGTPEIDTALMALKHAYSGKRKTFHAAVAGDTRYSNIAAVCEKLDTLFSKTRPDSILVTGDDGIGSGAEFWALQRYIPVEFVLPNLEAADPAAERAARLAQAATHVVLMAQPGKTLADIAVVKQAGDAAGRPVKLIAVPPEAG